MHLFPNKLHFCFCPWVGVSVCLHTNMCIVQGLLTSGNNCFSVHCVQPKQLSHRSTRRQWKDSPMYDVTSLHVPLLSSFLLFAAQQSDHHADWSFRVRFPAALKASMQFVDILFVCRKCVIAGITGLLLKMLPGLFSQKTLGIWHSNKEPFRKLDLGWNELLSASLACGNGQFSDGRILLFLVSYYLFYEKQII